MNQHKELLLLAAKAFLLECKKSDLSEDDSIYEMMAGYPEYNPFENEGQALRLAVKLKMGIMVLDNLSGIIGTGIYSKYSDCNFKPYRATCRAIVMAAAAIGREIE